MKAKEIIIKEINQNKGNWRKEKKTNFMVPVIFYYCDSNKYQEDELFIKYWDFILRNLPFVTINVKDIEVFFHYKWRVLEFDVLVKINHPQYTKLVAIELKESNLDKLLRQIMERIWYVDYGVIVYRDDFDTLKFYVGRLIEKNKFNYLREFSRIIFFRVKKEHPFDSRSKEKIEIVKGTGDSEMARFVSVIAYSPPLNIIIKSLKEDLEKIKKNFDAFYNHITKLIDELENYKGNLSLFLERGDVK